MPPENGRGINFLYSSFIDEHRNLKEKFREMEAEIRSLKLDTAILDELQEDVNNAAKCITKGDITELKTFANPPDIVQKVLICVALILNEKGDWPSAKNVSNAYLAHPRHVLPEQDKLGAPSRCVRRQHSDDQHAHQPRRLPGRHRRGLSSSKQVHLRVVHQSQPIPRKVDHSQTYFDEAG
jgi:hypothetical protein